MRPHGAAIVMRTGEPDAKNGFMCVPLMARDRPWGAITLLAGDRPFAPDDVDIATELGRRAAAAMETARLVQSLARSEERYRMLFEASPLPMWVYDSQTLGFLAVNEAAVRHYGYARQRVPRDDDQGHPSAGGRRGRARQHPGQRRTGIADAGHMAAPQEGRHDHRRRDHRRPRDLRGPPRRARPLPRRDRPAAARGAAQPGGEDGGDRPARRRRRARLQQPADGHLRLRRDPALAPRDRRRASSCARSPTPPSRPPR